jgi:hypothetical protein
MAEHNLPEKNINFLLYQPATAKVSMHVIMGRETVWFSQKAMSELFGCSTGNISLHLKNIFAEKELEAVSVTGEFPATAADGKKYRIKFYNLDAIISVGYRVNSMQATQFRIWATKTLKEYIIKGFVIDSDRLIQMVIGNFDKTKIELDPESAKYINSCLVKEYMNEYPGIQRW